MANWKRKNWWCTNKERPENVDLWQRLDAVCEQHQVEFRWVKGHAGNPENELWCPKCQTTFRIEEAKRHVEQPPSLF